MQLTFIQGGNFIEGEISDFDNHSVRRIKSLQIDWGDHIGAKIALVYVKNDVETHLINIELDRIVYFSIPATDGQLWLTEFDVMDVRDRQLEGVRYQIVDQFDRRFDFCCHSIRVVDCKSIGPN